MDNVFVLTAKGIEQYLALRLPQLDSDWWQKNVLSRLTFQQQRIAQERRFRTIGDLDFAALLRVFDQNWFELSADSPLPREGKNWIKELQTIRNKWAHRSATAMPPSEVYRDCDTAGRLLLMIGASPITLAQVEEIKGKALVLMVDGRVLTPASGDLSVHESLPKDGKDDPQSAKSAFIFSVGELVCLKSNTAVVMPVIEVLVSGAGECRYRVFQDGFKATYYESQLQSVGADADERKILSPEELHAYLTSLQLLAPFSGNLYSLRTGRVKFIPYQYRPVLKLIRADLPRLLIADEVGVGKTIEAGLIIKELRARMDLSSVLIICPKALVAERKWFLEMKRFDEHFAAFDGKMLRHCLRETELDGEWPEHYAKTILPFSLFDSDLIYGSNGKVRGRKNQGLLSLDPPPKFDLVIVDEAHHIRNPSTYLHQGIRYFCDNAEAVVFMTATPVQLGSQDLYTLLNVLRPDLIIDQNSFTKMAEPNRFINIAIQRCRAANTGWMREAKTALEDAAQTEWGRYFFREAPGFQKIYDSLSERTIDDAERVAMIRSIEEFYTFSSLITRTRRRDIGEFTTRKPETLTVRFTPLQQDLHDRLLDIIAQILAFSHGNQNVKFMMTTIRRQAASCLYGLAPLLEDILNRKIDQIEFEFAGDLDIEPDFNFVDQVQTDIASLLDKARNLPSHDPKVEAFIEKLQEKQTRDNNKALVFSTFRHTLGYLAKHTFQAGFRFGLIHGNVSDEDRAEIRRRFARPKEDVEALDVLLSSEVGCEGLDFQFCDFLINYDLPWNPMRIEQRIGRIDRYGQRSKTIAIVNIITPGTVDADIYSRCLFRIGVFQHTVGGNEEILGEITEQIQNIAESFELTPAEREKRLNQIADNNIRQLQEEQALEAKQADLFGLNIPTQEWDKEVAAADNYWLSSSAIHRCVVNYLTKRLGRDQEYLLGEKPLKTLRLSHGARGKILEDYRQLPRSTDSIFREWEKWLKGAAPMLQVTFEQETAEENSKVSLLSVTHPLVRQAALHLKTMEQVYTRLAVNSSDVPSGQYQFGIYRWSKVGVKLDDILVPVASDSAIEEKLFLLLQMARADMHGELPADELFNNLDARHHDKWATAQANHVAENRQAVEYRAQSLMVSHRARCKAIEDQLNRATNDKIRLMKKSELARANADYDRRMQALQRAAESGDVHATPVVFGVISVEK